ncbi:MULTISPECIES: Na+/H+ antiporter subunit G [Halomonas]|uniref:Multisubunit potassium/proton antiporter PhaG subunit n=1 Tax=Halomonas ventosae TaxID=229007 RepID=A0A4R6HNG1_9GAMM|nr:Na+/H+ antiporter subunit G [Halomonas ventosae]TDO09841.1 multisubunit potassium/proton antiporter PhaG subunit [Halomonas ventosae]
MNFYVFLEGVISFFLIAGGTFAFIGSLGMTLLKDFYMRLHGPTKSTTLGIGCILIGSIFYFSTTQGQPVIQELLITLFLFITAPVSAHLLAKTGLHLKLEHVQKTRGKPVELHDDEVGVKPVLHPDRGH